MKRGFLIFLPLKGWLVIFCITAYFSLSAQTVRKIEILNADITEFDNTLGYQASRLIGNVRFLHEDVLMNCDSAHYFPETNTLDAFSRVHLWREDSLQLFGNFLRYKGNTRTTEVRNNVVLLDRETQLKTNHIDYDLTTDIGYYLGGGDIDNGDNNIKSLQGYYYAKDKMVFFKDSVIVTNPEYIMYSDTLKYNTETEVAYFLGPTKIVAEENIIFCENGWYDTRNNISRFSRNASFHTENRILKGDSLYYERETGFGQGIKNVELIDSAQNIVLLGDHAIYHEKTGDAVLTQKAVMIQIDNLDSLFVHADTLKLVEDTIPDKRIIRAYRHVKIYRHDFQAKCDSLVYTDADSAFHFYGEPVLWSDENQLTAEFITIYTNDKKLDKIELTNTAFIISMEDETRFNQVKGRDMLGFFDNNELTRIEVDGNGQTVYFARENEEIIGLNKATSANLVIYLKDRKFERILFLGNPDATYYPIEKITTSESQLDNFKWFGEYRPESRDEIFIWKKLNGDIPDEEVSEEELHLIGTSNVQKKRDYKPENILNTHPH